MGLRDVLFARDAERDADPVSMVGLPNSGGGTGVLPYGVSVSSAVGLPAVWRCLDVLGTAVSQLPWTERRGTLDLPLSRLTRKPSAFYTRREWVQLVVRTLALYDIAYLLKLGPYDSEGVPAGLWPIPPVIIAPHTLDTWSLTPPEFYRIGRETVSASQVVVIRRGPLPGVPDHLGGVLNLAKAEIASAIASANYSARYWQAGGPPTTVLETEANLSDTQATSLGNRWAQKRSDGPDHPAILSNGLKARPFGADAASQSAVDARRDMVADVARYFGIPARMANAPSIDSQTYKTAQEENLDLLHYTLANYIGAIEDAITDLLPGGREMKMVTSALTEGTQLARYQGYQLATGNAAWMSAAEAREAEGLPPQEMMMMGPDDDSQRPMGSMPGMAQQSTVDMMIGSPGGPR